MLVSPGLSWENPRKINSKNEACNMRKLVFSVGMIVLLACALAGQTAEWKTINSTDGNFTVQFPGDAQDTVNQAGDSMTSHTLQMQLKPAIYLLVWSYIQPEQPVDDTAYGAFKTGFISKLPNCTTDSDQAAAPAFRGYIGHAYVLSCDYPQGKIKMKGNLYWGKHYSFAVMTAFAASVNEPAEIKKFMESFAVTDLVK
jgi:hypothetical protein